MYIVNKLRPYIVWVMCLLLTYLAGAFVEMNLNASEWNPDARGFVIVVWIFICIGVPIWWSEVKDKYKCKYKQ